MYRLLGFEHESDFLFGALLKAESVNSYQEQRMRLDIWKHLQLIAVEYRDLKGFFLGIQKSPYPPTSIWTVFGLEDKSAKLASQGEDMNLSFIQRI